MGAQLCPQTQSTGPKQKNSVSMLHVQSICVQTPLINMPPSAEVGPINQEIVNSPPGIQVVGQEVSNNDHFLQDIYNNKSKDNIVEGSLDKKKQPRHSNHEKVKGGRKSKASVQLIPQLEGKQNNNQNLAPSVPGAVEDFQNAELRVNS